MKVDLMMLGSPLRTAQLLGRAAESAGFDGVVITEGGRSAYLSCAAIALVTELELATGIAVAFPRSPMVTAQIAWELADTSAGRFRLGLGTQVRRHIEQRYGSAFEHPGPRLADYVRAVRAAFAAFRGAPLQHEGPFYSLTMLPAQWSPGPIDCADPPIDIAAVNPYMLQVAGEVADGVHVHPLNHPRYLREVVAENLAIGAARAGKDPASCYRTVPVFTAAGDTDEEQQRWREFARAQIAFYGSTPNYAFIFDMLGYEGTTARLRERQKAGDLTAMAGVIGDDLLDEFVVTGTFDEVPARLVERYEGLADRLVLYVAGLAWASDPGSLERFGTIAQGVRARSGAGR